MELVGIKLTQCGLGLGHKNVSTARNEKNIFFSSILLSYFC